MPHSSGGGSHSGGSHSGGSSHSHSSRSSGGSSSGGGLPSFRQTSSQPFRGSRRYLYYRDNKPYFVYTNYDVRKRDPMPIVSLILIMVLILIPWFIGCIVGICFSFKKPKKLSYYSKCPKLVIEDNIGVFEDENNLEESMEAFFDKTGIVPAVITVSNDTWNENYTNLENYAYDLYVNRFHDEYHWLIVYSEATKEDGFNDWYWEGMQGNNTDPILTEELAASFTESLHTKLLQRSKYSVDDAIAKTFDEYTPQMMKTYVDKLMLIMCVILLLACVAVMLYAIKVYWPEKVPDYYKNAKLCELTAVYQEPCNFCGGVYIIGMHTTCPHCGAALPAHHYIKDEQGNVVELLS